jgi:choline kinase
MKAIILAAGRGSRMGALTEEKPKCLVELGGKTLLSRQLAACREAGIKDIGIVTGYKKEAFASLPLTRFDNPRWAETNMVRSLQCAGEWLAEDNCIVSYSDIFYEPDAVRLLTARAAPISILYDVNWRAQWEARFADVLTDAETFRIEGERVTEIGNRAARIDNIEGQYMGLLHFTPEGWRKVSDFLTALPTQTADRLSMTELLQKLIAAGVEIIGVPYGGSWGEIDSADDLNVFQRAFA